MSADRWTARPALAGLVRAYAVVLPLLGAAGLAGTVGRLAPGPLPVRLLLALLTALAVAAALARLGRRLLPLAALLELSLLFPGDAPSRFAVALSAGSTRELTQRQDGPSAAAGPARDVVALLAALARHDRDTRRHTERVRAYTDLLGEALRLPEPDGDRLRWAALLHDLGKLTVAPAVLGKPSRLDASEWETVRGHPEAGARLAADLEPFLGEWFHAIGQHHERWDGTGYPQGLAGEQIGRAARIVAVADSFEVMTAGRSYRSALPAEQARAELVTCSGTQFDPAVVRALLDVSLARLERVVGPLAFLFAVPLVAPHDVVGLPHGVALHPAVSTHASASASGHDAGGSPAVTGHKHDGGAAASADPR
ncbi:MAG: hypothetical protein JWM64_1937 [Frankiales bacterium]|nr:hypothetical protein [Frankiales bacterium]